MSPFYVLTDKFDSYSCQSFMAHVSWVLLEDGFVLAWCLTSAMSCIDCSVLTVLQRKHLKLYLLYLWQHAYEYTTSTNLYNICVWFHWIITVVGDPIALGNSLRSACPLFQTHCPNGKWMNVPYSRLSCAKGIWPSVHVFVSTLWFSMSVIDMMTVLIQETLLAILKLCIFRPTPKLFYVT